MEKKKNIVLIGMMGAGKSTVSHFLDVKLKEFRLLDLDNEIESYTKKSIPDIFAEEGEGYFRELEHYMVVKYANYFNHVISTGGGVVENPENIKLLKQNGVLFYLSASPKALYDRVKASDNRPLLKRLNPEKALDALLEKRKSAYKTADFEINTENKTLLEISEEILEKYETATQS